MAIKPLLQQLLIWTSITIAGAHDTNLTGEVSQFIPACAQGCFKTFLQDNSLSTDCGTSPSLQCLCSKQTPSGLTIGEAATECLGGSAQFKVCQNNEVTSQSLQAAYHMCSNQANAIPNKSPLPLSAAFLISNGSVRILPPIPTASSSSVPSSTSSSSSVPTSLITSQSSRPTSLPTSSTLVTSSSTPTPAEGATEIPRPTEIAPPVAAKLGTGQIVGISVGVVGAVALALLAIFLARRARRRRYPGLDDDTFFPMDEKSSFGGTGGSDGGSAATRLTKIFHISPPILRTQQRESPQAGPPSTDMYNIDRGTIGLAISRPRSEIVPVRASPKQERRTSKLLPPKPLRPTKPNLTLNIPDAIHPALRPKSSQPQTNRTSTMTNATAFADLDTEAAEGAQIWRPPPTDPQSATTYYVADKYGNWVLGNHNRQSQVVPVTEAAELDTYTPLTKSPIERREEEAAALAAAMSAVSPIEVSKPRRAHLQPDIQGSRASSLYSQASAVRPLSRPHGPAANRSNSSGRKRPGRSDSKASMDSATTINTSSSVGGPFDEDQPIEQEPGRLSMLSPVAESPRTPTGRSPVTYPKIPGRLDPATIRTVPPPRRPDFTASPPGQPSPTLGSVLPVRDSPGAYPRPLNPKRGSRTGDKSIRAVPLQYGTGSLFSPSRPTVPKFPAPAPDLPLRSELRLSRQNMPRIDTSNLTPPQARVSSYMSPTSAVTTSSATSSLLAKRLGSERAAALSLEQGPRRPGAGWQRNGRPPGSAGLLSPEMAAMMSPGRRPFATSDLPATPTWQPKLTPTRRGDDLFLNVQ